MGKIKDFAYCVRYYMLGQPTRHCDVGISTVGQSYILMTRFQDFTRIKLFLAIKLGLCSPQASDIALCYARLIWYHV